MIDTNAYEKMTWETPSDELEDAVGNLLAEVKRLREALFACAEGAGDVPFFNKGGEGYEALFGGEEE